MDEQHARMRLFQIGIRLNQLDRERERLTAERNELEDEIEPSDIDPEAADNLNQALADVRDALQRQNEFARGVGRVSTEQAHRAIVDIISGQITGVGYGPRPKLSWWQRALRWLRLTPRTFPNAPSARGPSNPAHG